ncbi:MAG: S-layer family protein [Oscillatoriales cyanobacterium]|nr:MAG: S-layer family protein [Oscillatoriales cyanobacterium]
MTWSILAIALATPVGPAIANPVSDGSLSTEVAQPAVNRWTIEGGDRAGSNLFHSFQQFSIPTGGSVHFNNAADVANIFSRVTGGQRSTIDGELSANGGANLFLLNPAGILFGPNARLNLGGSFFASTADRLVFADGLSFGVNDAAGRPLLSMTVPVGLQYGAAPGPIRVEARSTDPTATVPTGLEVKPGQAIGLFGGSLAFDQGWAIAPEGRIWAVAAGPGTVVNFNRLLDTPIALGANLTFQGGGLAVSGNGGGELVAIGDRVQLSQGALLAANTLDTGDGRGLWVRSGEFGLTDRSAVSTITLGSGRSGDLSLTAERSISLSSGQDFAAVINQLLNNQFTENSIEGGLFSVSLGTGNAGQINLISEDLILSNGSVIVSSTFNSGRGGDVVINATRTVRLSRAGLFSGTAGSGRSGDLISRSRYFELVNTGAVSSLTLSNGPAGNIDIEASDSITLIGGDLIPLNIGNFRSDTKGGIEASAFLGGSAAGGIQLTSPSISLDDVTVVSTSVDFPGRNSSIGTPGDINLNSAQILIRNGAAISAGRLVQSSSTEINDPMSSTQNGRVVINSTELVEVDGDYRDRPSQVSSSIEVSYFSDGIDGSDSNSNASFNAGTIEIFTRVMRVIRGGQIQSTTSTVVDPKIEQFSILGNGGNILISASERIELDHLRSYQLNEPLGPAGLFTSTNFTTVDGQGIDPVSLFPSGRAGNIQVITPELLLRNGARITASSFGTGGAGNIDIQANRIRIIGENSAIRSLSGAGDAGNIRIQANEIELRDGGTITTDAFFTATGGNIEIDTDTLAALGNSDISANAVTNFGGRVNLRAQGVFGTAFRNAPTDRSDITVSSARGPEFSGTVQLEVLNPNPAQGAIALPSNVGVPPEPAQTCGPVDRPEQIGFFPLGRAGRQPTPLEPAAIENGNFWADLRPIAPSTTATTPLPAIAAAPVEATGWQTGEDGRLELVAVGAAPVTVGQPIEGRICRPGSAR